MMSTKVVILSFLVFLASARNCDQARAKTGGTPASRAYDCGQGFQRKSTNVQCNAADANCVANPANKLLCCEAYTACSDTYTCSANFVRKGTGANAGRCTAATGRAATAPFACTPQAASGAGALANAACCDERPLCTTYTCPGIAAGTHINNPTDRTTARCAAATCTTNEAVCCTARAACSSRACGTGFTATSGAANAKCAAAACTANEAACCEAYSSCTGYTCSATTTLKSPAGKCTGSARAGTAGQEACVTTATSGAGAAANTACCEAFTACGSSYACGDGFVRKAAGKCTGSARATTSGNPCVAAGAAGAGLAARTACCDARPACPATSNWCGTGFSFKNPAGKCAAAPCGDLAAEKANCCDADPTTTAAPTTVESNSSALSYAVAFVVSCWALL